MPRIIAGTLKGRILQVPPSGTRPTSERVREAIFSRLEHMGVIEDARVLDLYAGSGALGFEAISRGATSLTLVDSSAAAIRTLKKNLPLVPEALVIGADALSAVSNRLSGSFDLVFVDPPYDVASQDITELLKALLPLCSPDASIVVERSTRSPEVEIPEGLMCEDRRDWGETRVFFLAPPLDEQDHESE